MLHYKKKKKNHSSIYLQRARRTTAFGPIPTLFSNLLKASRFLAYTKVYFVFPALYKNRSHRNSELFPHYLFKNKNSRQKLCEMINPRPIPSTKLHLQSSEEEPLPRLESSFQKCTSTFLLRCLASSLCTV